MAQEQQIDVREFATKAIKLADEIGGWQYSSRESYLRSKGEPQMMLMLDAVLDAAQFDGPKWQRLALDATYDCHGVHLDLDDVDDNPFNPEASHQVVVRVECSYAVNDLTAIAVVGFIVAEVKALADEKDIWLGNREVIVVLAEPEDTHKA